MENALSNLNDGATILHPASNGQVAVRRAVVSNSLIVAVRNGSKHGKLRV